MTVVFEDVHDFKGTHEYVVPNEDVSLWREIVKEIPIGRAGGICSAGEIGFFSILPSVKKELILVDHSYRSLHVAILKYLIIKEKGIKETQRIFLTGNVGEMQGAIASVRHLVPDVFRDGNKQSLKFGDAWGNTSFYGDIKREWTKIRPNVAKKAERKFDKIRFVHGDLTDLKRYGKMNFLYISNAHQYFHDSRTGRSVQSNALEEIVGPGGFIMCAHPPGNISYERNSPTRDFGWEKIHERDYTGGFNHWNQAIYRVPERT